MANDANEWVLEPVPHSDRKPLFSVLSTLWGFMLFPTVISVGTLIASNFSLWEFVVIVLISSFVLSVACVVTGIVAQRTGCSSQVIQKYVFGKRGYIIPAILLTLGVFGWGGFIIGLQSQIFAVYINQPGWVPLTAAVISLFFVLPTLIGIRGISLVSYVMVPLIIILLLLSVFKSVQFSGGWSQILALNQGTSNMTMLSAITAAVGTWALGAAVSAMDFSRFIKNDKHTLISCGSTFMIGFPLLIFTGSIAGLVTGEGDIIQAWMKVGLLGLGFWGMLLLTYTTMQTTYYICSIALGNVFKVSNRKMLTVISAVVIYLLVVFNILEYINTWVTVMVAVSLPLAGLIAADFFVLNRAGYAPFDKFSVDWKAFSFVSWFIGAFTVIVTENLQIGIPSIQGMVVAFICQWIFGYFVQRVAKPSPLDTNF